MTITTGRSDLQPVFNWCNLLRAEEVTLHRRNQTVTIGRIDMVAIDGSVFWIIEDNGNSRRMIHRNDGLEVYRGRTAFPRQGN